VYSDNQSAAFGEIIAGGVEEGLSAEGSFAAINSRINQIVPDLDVHVLPRREPASAQTGPGRDSSRGSVLRHENAGFHL